MMTVPQDDIYAMSTDDLIETIEMLRDDVSEMAQNWYSPEQLQDECESVEDAVRDEYRHTYGPVAVEAHRILSDLAWRATTGDPSAQAAEAELADFLRRVRDIAA